MQRKLKVLSLFDGCSGAQQAIKRLGIDYYDYYACEIDKYAIKITQKNFPNTIQLGDVTEIDFKALGEIDLVVAGSPCQGFSFAGKQLNFEDPRSKLFFEVVRAIKECKPKYFLLENVKMKKEYQGVITEHLGVPPIEINSALVSAQNRKRLYWTNIPNITQPEDRGILLKSIIDGTSDREKSYCLDANYFKGGNPKQYFEKNRRQLVFNYSSSGRGNGIVEGRFTNEPEKSLTLTATGHSNRSTTGVVLKDKPQTILSTIYKENPKSMIKRNKKGLIIGSEEEDVIYWRKLTPIECERLQTMKDNYTEGVSNTQRYKMLGNGFTVDVIVHILKNMEF